MDIRDYIFRQLIWSGLTFGTGDRTAGIIDHIRKELAEIEADPGDVMEWIDVVILALDGAWRKLVANGMKPQTAANEVENMLHQKYYKNEGRKWPDWRTADPGKAIEHVKEEESRCSVCGEPQIETPSGISCANGHGGADSFKFEPDILGPDR